MELYYGRLKTKVLFVSSDISISFPRPWSQYHQGLIMVEIMTMISGKRLKY